MEADEGAEGGADEGDELLEAGRRAGDDVGDDVDGEGAGVPEEEVGAGLLFGLCGGLGGRG